MTRSSLRRTLPAGLAVSLLAVGALGASGAAAVPSPDHTVDEIAHRGSSFEQPENTLAAVREGIDDKVDFVEIDVQRTADGEIVLMHDTSLRRTTDVEQVFPDRAPWTVADFTYAELLQLDAGSWKGQEFAGEQIPTLAEAVRELRSSRSGLLLEVKSPALYPGIGPDIADVLADEPGYLTSAVAGERLVVQSFDWDFMAEFDALLPQVPAGLLGAPTTAQLPELSTWADQINPHHSAVTSDYVAAVHAQGMTMNTWTVDDPAIMRRVIDLGVDGVITNQPDVLAEVLGGR